MTLLTEEGSEEAISRMSQEDWLPLLELRQRIEDTDEFKSVAPSGKYFVLSDVVKDFHTLVYNIPIAINFDWPKWTEGRKVLDEPPEDFGEFNLVYLCKLITVVVRAERFSEGYLPAKFADGTIGKILDAIDRQISSFSEGS